MESRLMVSTIIKDGNLSYQIYDKETKQTYHCEIGELNSVIWKILGVWFMKNISVTYILSESQEQRLNKIAEEYRNKYSIEITDEDILNSKPEFVELKQCLEGRGIDDYKKVVI